MIWSGPFEIVNPHRRGPIAIVCDHASNALPPDVAGFGVSASDMARHIAFDIGAAPIARHLAEMFDAPAVIAGVSRLVIDCNRHLHDPTLIPEISDGTVIPANRNLTQAARELRIARYFTPYHAACREMLDQACAAGRRPLFVSVHSMTDRMNGAFRPWEVSLSSNDNRRATDPVLAALRSQPELTVGDNQPYNMDATQDYTTPLHALSRGLDYVQVEFRQDVVNTVEGQARYARIFAEALRAVC